jgi:hypothetical protein
MEVEDFVTAGSAEDDVVRNFMAVRFGKRSQETSVRKSWMERENKVREKTKSRFVKDDLSLW